MATCARVMLKNILHEQFAKSQKWLDEHFAQATAVDIPFYSSFDLRDADYKVAPVDANLFPAGFNNICGDDLEVAGDIATHAFARIIGRQPSSVLIIPENHTRNHYYAENLYELRQIFRTAGIRCEIGWWENEEQKLQSAEGADHLVHLTTPEGHELLALPVKREGTRLVAEDFDPDVIIINNDYSSGLPPIYEGLTQPILPNPRLGWHTRRKDRFFNHYNRLVKEYAATTGIDPWAFTIETEKVANVNFDTGEGLDRVAAVVEKMLAKLSTDYSARGLTQKPFVFVKNNAGTYGIGVMKVNTPEEILNLNRRDKNKMSIGKNNTHINEVIVQEGIPTRFSVEGAAAEPVIYMMGSELLGGFLRKNPNRGNDDNLNSKGMVFQKLCIADLKREADRDLELELVYGTLSRIAAAALVEEMKDYK